MESNVVNYLFALEYFSSSTWFEVVKVLISNICKVLNNGILTLKSYFIIKTLDMNKFKYSEAKFSKK